MGFNVLGADLSKNSIESAKAFENDTLKFHVHDMRKQLVDKYNAIFNLFTSFGYFDDDQSNIDVLINFKNGLKENGYIVIDFLNIESIKKNLIAKNTIVKNGIHFFIERTIQNDFLVKKISFHVDGTDHNYSEKIKAFSLEDFTSMIEKANLQIKNVFGDYSLSKFNAKNSERLILILQ